MLSGISFPEVLPLGLPEERPFGPKYMPLSEFECGDMSPRVSTGPSACSMASSSSEVEGINDLFSFPLAQGSKPTIIAADHDQSQLPLVTLDEDLEDALGLICPSSCGPPVDFGPDSSVPLALHQPCGGALTTDEGHSPVMLPSQKPEEDVNMDPSTSSGDGKQQKIRRRVGRPRVEAAPHAVAPAAASGDQKRGRGPKPKYVFATTDEALDARKERNRKAALESYYRKRQKTQALNQEMEKLKAENARLEKLAVDIESGVVVLEEASEKGLNAWLARHTEDVTI